MLQCLSDDQILNFAVSLPLFFFRHLYNHMFVVIKLDSDRIYMKRFFLSKQQSVSAISIFPLRSQRFHLIVCTHCAVSTIQLFRIFLTFRVRCLCFSRFNCWWFLLSFSIRTGTAPSESDKKNINVFSVTSLFQCYCFLFRTQCLSRKKLSWSSSWLTAQNMSRTLRSSWISSTRATTISREVTRCQTAFSSSRSRLLLPNKLRLTRTNGRKASKTVSSLLYGISKSINCRIHWHLWKQPVHHLPRAYVVAVRQRHLGSNSHSSPGPNYHLDKRSSPGNLR